MRLYMGQLEYIKTYSRTSELKPAILSSVEGLYSSQTLITLGKGSGIVSFIGEVVFSQKVPLYIF